MVIKEFKRGECQCISVVTSPELQLTTEDAQRVVPGTALDVQMPLKIVKGLNPYCSNWVH